MLHGKQPVLHMHNDHRPGIHPNLHHAQTKQHYNLERTLQFRLAVLTQHGELQYVTSYKPSRDWRKARRQGLRPTVGGILGSHWTTGQISPASSWTAPTERCCPATVRYQEPYEKQPATSAPGNLRQRLPLPHWSFQS